MSTAVAQLLEGMPDPHDLRCTDVDGQTVVSVGSRVLFCYDRADRGMRNLAVVTLRSLGFAGRRVAAVLGLSQEYVATLNQRAARQGSAGLVRRRGRPPKLSQAAVGKARAWRAQGVSNVAVARRLGVDDSTVSRALASHGRPRAVPVQPSLPTIADDEDVAGDAAVPTVTAAPAADAWVAGVVDAAEQPPAAGAGSAAGADQAAGASTAPAADSSPADRPAPGTAATARTVTGAYDSRYAGAMLLHAFYDRVDAGAVLATVTSGTPGRRYDDLGVLCATSLAFALGASSVEGTKHLLRGQAGPLAGLASLPELRTLRPRLAGIADHTDPLGLQRALATAVLAADAPSLGVYFVDDHFVPYEGAKPVGKGWNSKRRHAQKGRADTLVTDYGGRAVCFVTGEPSGLTKTLPLALAELTQLTGDAKLLLGFDRGGAYPVVFACCRERGVDWLTWRRGALAPCTAAPARHWRVAPDGRTECITLADETVTIDGYGPCRQLTLFEDGVPKLQVLTSDTTAPAAALLGWLRCRWRIENAFKYLARHHGIDWLCDYRADLVPDTTMVPNPQRTAARAALKAAQGRLADAERAFAQLLGDHNRGVAAVNKAIPAAQKRIARAEQAVEAATAKLRTIPAKLPANQLNPDAQRALLRPGRRSLQMVLRLLAYNAELWLADQLNAYLHDPDEYRATTRNLLHLGGLITYTTQAVTVTLDRPATPLLTRALGLLLDQLNATPPRLPADPRPITYQLNPAPH